MKSGIVLLMIAFCVLNSQAQSSLFTMGERLPVNTGPWNGHPASGPMVTADFNRDGKADLVIASNSKGTLTVLLGDGKANFTEAPGSPIEAPDQNLRAIAQGDFNRDGNPDLALADGQGVYVLLGDGKGGFAPGVEIPSRIDISPAALLVADFNGDGNLDIFAGGPIASFSLLFLGNGAGVFGTPLMVLGNTPAIDFAAGDFRGDGTMGVAAVDTQGRLSVTVWNGENDFQPIYPQQGPPVSLVGAGTFDGNSQSEASYFTGSTCWTWKWTGANQFGNFLKSQLPVAPTALTTGDFNGDGKLDWAGTDPDSGTVIAAAGDGKGGFTAAPGSPYVVGGTPYAIVAADFNGDGKSDLAVDTGSDVVILLNSNPYAGGTLLFVSSVVNAASYAAGTVAPESYAAAFGSKLAASAGDPTVAVTIVDATGRRAAASVVYASPGQVNFLVPAGLAAGAGGLQISNSLGSSVLAPLTVAPVAPGLFTVDSAGKVPAAQVVSLDANNYQTFQPVANCAGNSCTLAPIVLNPADQNYLILYGTGIRGNGGTSGVTVTLGGDEAPVAYAGPQGQYPGLDQVNVQIPQSFGVQGKVTVTLSIGSIGPPAASNSVEVEFR